MAEASRSFFIPLMHNVALIAGRYRIVRSLGKGGYAEVHEVVDETTGARLALKQLTAKDAAKNVVRELFRREFNTLAQLAHPLIVRVFDYGVDGTPYYTMELISGASLAGPIAWAEACALLRDVASALSLVHSRRLVHRDVTHRNVYKTEDGHAKLFDFGALAPMGLTTEIVGTPAYIPPEAVTDQRLDARSDLFSLGALGYLLLTGRHAFPARRLGDLGEVWGQTVEVPSHFAADVPRALDELILALLSRDPIARPTSAAEVFNRLTAIAALPAAEAPEVAQAYLSTPALVGRSDADRQFRQALLRCRRGKGGSLLLEGARGLGRSRLLSSFLLDAKLDGLLTARAEPGASESESLALARALMRQLESAEPAMLRDAAQPHDEILSQLLQDDSVVSADRVPSVIDALVATVCSLSRAKPLVIGVDDFERADVPSKQLIIRLAKAAPSSTLVLVVTLVQDATTEAHVLLRDLSSSIALTPLSASETNELTKSLFGEVAHVQTIGSWIHRLSQGTPRTALEAATHLVDSGTARFEEGSWVLPGRLDELELPASIDQTLDARVVLLGPDARGLCQALALSSEEDPLHAHEYGELCPGVSGARLDAVLDELFTRGILVPPASSPAFVHEGLRAAARRSIPGPQLPDVHRRVASAYRSGSTPSLVLSAYHSLEAGDTELAFAEGARAVHRRATISIRGAAFLRTEEGTRAFERLFEWGLATKKPWPDVLTIGQMLLQHAAVADARLVRHREPVIARLRLDSGLADWEGLSEIPDPVARIQTAVGNAFMRHQSAPEAERGLPPPEAIEMLCGAVAGLCGVFARRLEHAEVLALLPLLEPFRLLSPAVGAVAEMLGSAVDSMMGRCVNEQRKRVILALSSPIPGLEEVPRIGMWWLNLYYQALDDASYGRPGAAEPVHPLLSTAMYAPLAWDARLQAALFQGDLEGAEAARKERELSKLTRSDGAHAQLEGGFVYEVSAYDFLGDVLQLKRCLPRLERRAHERPATRARYVLHLGNYYRLRGQLAKAIAAYEEALAIIPSPAAGGDWAYIVMRYAHTLVDVGRAAEARDLCVRSVTEATAFRYMRRLACHIEMKLAIAEAALGQTRAAAERSERIIEEAVSEGIGGVLFANLCRDQALAAQLARDEGLLERAISRLERLAANSKFPAFATKHAHLFRQAQGRGGFQVAPNPSKPLGDKEVIHTSLVAGHRTQIELCKGRGQRAQRALRILLETAASDEGYLYLIEDAGITLAASVARSEPPAALEESLAERVRAGSVEAATTDETTQMESLRPEADTSFDVVEVVTETGGRFVLAALAAMKPRNGALLPVPMVVRTTLSDALIKAGDTVAIPWT